MSEQNLNTKLCLTVPEAVTYSGLGRPTIEALLKDPKCNFLLKVGNRRYIKRQLFEEYLNDTGLTELTTK